MGNWLSARGIFGNESKHIRSRLEQRKGERSSGAVHSYKPKNLSCVTLCFLCCYVEVGLTARTLSPLSMLQMTLPKLCLFHWLDFGLLGNRQGQAGQIEKGKTYKEKK